MAKVLTPIHSVLNPSAQTVIPCAACINYEQQEQHVKVSDTLKGQLAPLEMAVVQFMEATGCRVSEVLNITPQHVSSNGAIMLKASKGSNDRLVYSGAWSQWFVYNRLKLPLSQQGYNRWYFYRLFKRLGIYSVFGAREKTSVTHYFRHKLAAELRSDSFDNSKIQLALGHKNKNNTLKYGR